eukprot:TRINITY_DN9085_c0_g1_i3.p1 TRINITY_DN9085_c0_g1~~TRINITY_DN9085_c0_g1_i3.p1  ORF type:complete len:169 (+),score=20.30 TRINITY_DN9085_c0_g1_i3:25-507(+)
MDKDKTSTDQSPTRDNSFTFQYVNPYKFAYGVGAAGLLMGFAIGITRSGGKSQMKNRSAMQIAVGAFAVGTALCGSSAYLISRGVMKAMDVNNMQEFARKLRGEVSPRLEAYRPTSFERGGEEIQKIEASPTNLWNFWDLWANPQAKKEDGSDGSNDEDL